MRLRGMPRVGEVRPCNAGEWRAPEDGRAALDASLSLPALAASALYLLPAVEELGASCRPLSHELPTFRMLTCECVVIGGAHWNELGAGDGTLRVEDRVADAHGRVCALNRTTSRRHDRHALLDLLAHVDQERDHPSRRGRPHLEGSLVRVDQRNHGALLHQIARPDPELLDDTQDAFRQRHRV
eukprot:CAMPEP_0179877958 /NCGR_PEP_ID=MMETSP0982-20121206/25059_1 /TAXON_ID=483367 /ORGANISM="non described non described, Strain CCMP 2436" /LENGTH=183 /DNA_ID=CAMNT_0021770575 /DNA_START=104 /DNA_END=657 /DNA_ORIENTATION=+